jgi:hypothetical protein
VSTDRPGVLFHDIYDQECRAVNYETFEGKSAFQVSWISIAKSFKGAPFRAADAIMNHGGTVAWLNVDCHRRMR